MHTTLPPESGGIVGRFAAHAAANDPRPTDPAFVAELVARLRRTTYLLNSARLVITDDAARAIAAEAVGESLSTLARVQA